MDSLPRTDAELAIDPTPLQDAVLELLEAAGLDTATNDAIMVLIEKAEAAKFRAGCKEADFECDPEGRNTGGRSYR